MNGAILLAAGGLSWLLAQAAPDAMPPATPAPPQYVFRPFVTPAPVWDYWPLLLLPLCLGIAIVYKSIRCRSMSRVPREAAALFAFIVGVMVVASLALAGLVRVVEWLAGR